MMIFKEFEIEYSGGKVRASASGSNKNIAWESNSAPDRFVLNLTAEKEIELLSVRAVFERRFSPEEVLFLNGYQSWTDSAEHNVNEKLHGIDKLPKFLVNRFAFNRYGDYDFASYSHRKGNIHGWTYGYIRKDDRFEFIGSLCEESGYTLIRFDCQNSVVVFEKDCANHCFMGDYKAFDVVFAEGGEDYVFDKYFESLRIPKPNTKRITGYTSWYNRYENITEASVTEDLNGFVSEAHLPDVFQIDDGYESAVGDWLIVDSAKFPSGMKVIADSIRERGMIPGIWLAPFAAENDSRLVKEHPDWLLRDKNGAPVTGGSNWSGFYGLDIYNPEFRDYLKKVFDTVLNEWGYKLVKLDFLYAACVVPRRDKTRAQIMYDGMKFLRELCGEALILGCGVPLAPAFGIVDYCRIGCDVSLSWDDVAYMRLMHRERVSTRNSLMNTVFRRQLDGRAFRNDPDVFLLRDDNIKLTQQEKKVLATVNSLFGGVLFTSDNVGRYDDSKKQVYDHITQLDRHCVRKVENGEKAVVITYISGGAERRISIKK